MFRVRTSLSVYFIFPVCLSTYSSRAPGDPSSPVFHVLCFIYMVQIVKWGGRECTQVSMLAHFFPCMCLCWGRREGTCTENV